MRRVLVLIACLALLLTSSVSAQETTPTPEYVTYMVVQGDTLGRISARFHTTTREIMLANQLSDPNLIFTGMILRIPVVTPTPPASATSAATLTPAAAPTDAPTSAPSATEIQPSPTAETPVSPEPPTLTPPASETITPIAFDAGSEIFSFGHLDAMHSAGMTWAKIEIRWRPGMSVDNARRAIEIIHQNGFSVLLQVTGSAPPADYFMADYFPDFASYLGEVAAFAPDAIEVWDGMNVEAEWAHGLTDPTAYAYVLESAFRAIKTASPTTLVISGALAEADASGAPCIANTGCDALSYLAGLAAAGAGLAADCIGMPYTLGAVPPQTSSTDPRGDQALYYYSTVVSIYAGIFPDKPLCLTKIGYLLPQSPDATTTWAANTTPESRAEWLAQAVLLARQSGRIRLFIVDNLDATAGAAADYAIVGADGRCISCLTLSAVLRAS